MPNSNGLDDNDPLTDDNFSQGASLPYIIAGSATLPFTLFVIYTFAKYKVKLSDNDYISF